MERIVQRIPGKRINRGGTRDLIIETKIVGLHRSMEEKGGSGIIYLSSEFYLNFT